MRSKLVVAAFLVAIAAANLLIARYGQVALVFTAWVVIPFDMLARDILHERWRGNRLAARMGGLVAAGAALAVVVNPASLRISASSCVAFAIAMTINSVVFEVLVGRSSKFARMNISNLAASIVDSIVFPLLAFGGLDAWLSVAQAGSKFAGGLAWSGLVLFALPHVRRDSHSPGASTRAARSRIRLHPEVDPAELLRGHEPGIRTRDQRPGDSDQRQARGGP